MKMNFTWRPPTKLFNALLKLAFALALLILPARADTFGVGTNTFTIEFAEVGNAGNGDDLGAGGGSYSQPFGGVAYLFRIGVTEVPQDWITKATRVGMTNVTADAWSGNLPAANITWYEGAAFVNWLNTSAGRHPAYDLICSGGIWSMRLWSSAEAWQSGGENLYRHKDTFYFLPSEDEWYKAAFHKNDGVTANYWDYTTGGNSAPAAVASGTAAGTAVYNQAQGSPPTPVDSTGGPSSYGTRGQGGNAGEFRESAFDGLNDSSSESRVRGGGRWYLDASQLRSSFRVEHNASEASTGIGFRVAALPTDGPPVIQAQPRNQAAPIGGGAVFTVAVVGSRPFFYEWQFNGIPLPAGTNSALTLVNLTLNDAGSYSVLVSNLLGSVMSEAATLIVAPILITSQPGNTNVLSGSNVTLRVTAVSPMPITYQWQFNGADLLGQTNSTLVITNARFEPNTGYYRVRISDATNSLVSDIAALAVLVRPVIISPPTSQTVLQGGTAAFTIVGAPDHPLLPLTYRWLRNGATYLSNGPPTLFVKNCQSNATIRCQLINTAGTAASAIVSLTVLPDFDGDGMADAWEILHGFDTNNLADGALDFDGDGLSNRGEYTAGTDPTNAASVLKLQIAPSAPGLVTVMFIGLSNRTYRVEWNTQLRGSAWTRLLDVLAQPRDRIESVTDTNATDSARFYRLVTPHVSE